VFGAALVLVLFSTTTAQVGASLSPAKGPPPPPVEPVDASYVPEVVSKTQALEVVSIVREDPFIHIKLKNKSEKRIYSFRYSYHENGQSVMIGFINADEHPFIGPGEVYAYEYAYVPTSIFARQPVTFQAVLFEDGTVDGEPDRTSFRFITNS